MKWIQQCLFSDRVGGFNLVPEGECAEIGIAAAGAKFVDARRLLARNSRAAGAVLREALQRFRDALPARATQCTGYSDDASHRWDGKDVGLPRAFLVVRAVVEACAHKLTPIHVHLYSTTYCYYNSVHTYKVFAAAKHLGPGKMRTEAKFIASLPVRLVELVRPARPNAIDVSASDVAAARLGLHNVVIHTHSMVVCT